MTLIDFNLPAMSVEDAVREYGLEWGRLRKLQTPILTTNCEGFWARVPSKTLNSEVLISYCCKGSEELVQIRKVLCP